MVIAIMALTSVGPSTATMPSARISVGNASIASITRMMTLSIQPPA